MNSNYDSTEEALLITLVHEMCHYYTYCDGYCPRQGHGPEFREIGEIVGRRSQGRFTIQRFASAEEMAQRTLDANLQAKKDKRALTKKTNTMALFVYLANGEIRLITTTSLLLINSVLDVHKKLKNGKEIIKAIKSNDPNLIEFLYANGYNKTMRTYRYWSVENKPWIKDIENQYNFENITNNQLMENINNDTFSIDPNMDLSLRSPLEGLEEEKIEITESDIKKMVSEAVGRILNKLK